MLINRSSYTNISSYLYALCKDFIKYPDSDMEYLSAEAAFGMLEYDEQIEVLNDVQPFKDILVSKYGQGFMESVPDDETFSDLVYHGIVEVPIKLKIKTKAKNTISYKMLLKRLEKNALDNLFDTEPYSLFNALFPYDRYTFYISNGTWDCYNFYGTLKEEHILPPTEIIKKSEHLYQLDNGYEMLITVSNGNYRKVSYHLKHSHK